jgi:hypothetical protein
MTVITGPELASLRHGTLAELTAALPGGAERGVRACADRLYHVLRGDDERWMPQMLSGRTVLVAYGGGKDSAYMLAVVRAAQLLLAERHGVTFRVRAVTNRHAGMPYEVMANVHRTYCALQMYSDPDCEQLLIDGDQVREFRVDAPRCAEVVATNRSDILMTGHRTGGDGRPTFCNACNFAVANAYGIAATHDGGVDIIVTGDSPHEQRAYLAWIRRLARGSGLPPGDAGRNFPALLATIDELSQAYFGEIHGPGASEVQRHRVTSSAAERLRFFSVYDDTAYSAGDHWDLLTGYLGFRFDEAAFNFTESDCGNPALMAHLRGLKTERVYGRSYAEGLTEYLEFALELMRRKEFPERLLDVMRSRYSGAGGAARMRAMADRYARETFSLTEENLVCMVYAPFLGRGASLDDYLAREQPDLAGHADAIRELMNGGAARVPADRITDVSGLSLPQLRVLFRAPARPDGAPAGGMVGRILEGDPHKSVLRIRKTAGGPVVDELVSGR